MLRKVIPLWHKVEGGSTLLRRLSIGFFVVAIAEATGLWMASFWALSDLSELNMELVEITRSLDATRDLSRELGRLILTSQQVSMDRKAVPMVRESITAVSQKLKTCASSTCHGTRTDPAQMVASIAPEFTLFSERFEALFNSREATPEERAVWSLESLRMFAATQTKLARMSSTLLTRVEDLRESSERVPARARRNFFLLITAGIGLAWAAASFSASRLLQPLGRLLGAIRNVAEGRLAQKIEVTGPQEIHELADSFNNMAVRLQGYRDELEEANRTLEQRVEERTEELKRSQEVLYRSEKLSSLGLLTSGVAHEINNPLTGMLMNIDLLMEEEEEGSSRWRELQKVSQDAERCKHIIDELREFSRERVFSKAEVDLTELLRRTLRLLEVILEKKKIRVEEESSEENLVVRCDAGKIQQVFTNVVLNAVDAMPQEGILKVRSRRSNGYAIVTFTDNGSGVLPQDLSRVFDPFFTTKSEGTGLGLSICYGIITKHGGSLEIENRGSKDAYKKGTTVSISLPLEEADTGGVS
jgi:two-component system NtrC family sensor kinase